MVVKLEMRVMTWLEDPGFVSQDKTTPALSPSYSWKDPAILETDCMDPTLCVILWETLKTCQTYFKQSSMLIKHTEPIWKGEGENVLSDHSCRVWTKIGCTTCMGELQFRTCLKKVAIYGARKNALGLGWLIIL